MISYENFSTNLRSLRERVDAACSRYGRDTAHVRILPVTKTHPVDAALYALRAGLSAVGENRVQEALEKMQQPGASAVQWELIGHLQTNKAKLAAKHFARIQSVDSVELARKLDRHAGEAQRVLPILVQVNAGDDPAKFGTACAGAEAVVTAALACPNLKVEGLMTIAPLSEDRTVARRAFERLRETRDKLSGSLHMPLAELSMGMSDDLEEAIAAGSTLIRVGTFLFGTREAQT